MPKNIRHLRVIRRRAWVWVMIGLAGQFTAATFDPTMQTGAALAAPLQETAR